MLIGKWIFLFFYFVMENNMTNGQSTEGCAAAGVTSCCQSGPCQVPESSGNCFCDQSCYSTSDCCNDIEFICPHPDPVGSGESDTESSGTPPTSDPTASDRPPRLIVFEANQTILLDTATTSRLLINVTYDPGSPQGLLVWRHNGVVISSRTDPRVSVLTNGGLTIRSVRPSDRGEYSVMVLNRAGNSSANFTVLTKPPIEVSFESPSYTFGEGSGRVEVCVVSSGIVNPVNLALSVSTNSSAQVGADFVLTSTSLTLHPNETRSCVDVVIVDDLIVESTEQLRLNLVSTGSDIIPTQTTTILITDNDFIKLVFEEAVYEVSESIADPSLHLALVVCVTRLDSTLQIEIPDGSAEITISTEDITARGGLDFVARRADLNLANSITRVCECIQLLPDELAEGSEEFDVVVSSSHPGILGSRSIVTIKDDDEVTIDLEMTGYTVSEDSLGIEVCVRVTGSVSNIIALYMCTEGETAKDGEDYIGLTTRRLVFTPTSTQPSIDMRQCVTIPVIDDTLLEGRERFLVQIQSDPRMPDGVLIGQNSTASVTILDNDTPDAVFNNNTPNVQGNTIAVNFIVQRRHFTFSRILCTLKGPGRTPPIIRNCTTGALTFSQLPLRHQEFEIKIEGMEQDGGKVLLNRRELRLDTDVCSLHLMNEGVRVSGSNATVEWQATGPNSSNKVRHFTCWKDRIRTGFPCSSPFLLTDENPGKHRLIVRPETTAGCRKHISRVIQFTV